MQTSQLQGNNMDNCEAENVGVCGTRQKCRI